METVLHEGNLQTAADSELRQFKGVTQFAVFKSSLLLKKNLFFLTTESDPCLQCSLFCPTQQCNRHSSMAWICHWCSS